MRKKSGLIGLFVVALSVATAGCSKDSDSSNTEQTLVENFKALVLGGKDIDSLQTWSTAKGVTVKVNVNFDDTNEYPVYILPANPANTTDVAYLGMVRVLSGSSKTISIACPVAKSQLYAACYNSKGQVIIMPFVVDATTVEITINGAWSSNTMEEPLPNCIYYAFETPSGTFRDFDYNDVVLRVGALTEREEGNFVSNIQIMCIGNSLKTTLLYKGDPLGDELHSVIGVSTTQTANVSNVTRVFAKVGELTFSDGSTRIDQLDFSLMAEDSDGNKWTLHNGEAPLYIVVNGNDQRQWFWPSDGFNIGVAYPHFSSWASNRLTAIDWYDSSNAATSKVVKWTADDE